MDLSVMAGLPMFWGVFGIAVFVVIVMVMCCILYTKDYCVIEWAIILLLACGVISVLVDGYNVSKQF